MNPPPMHGSPCVHSLCSSAGEDCARARAAAGVASTQKASVHAEGERTVGAGCVGMARAHMSRDRHGYVLWACALMLGVVQGIACGAQSRVGDQPVCGSPEDTFAPTRACFTATKTHCADLNGDCTTDVADVLGFLVVYGNGDGGDTNGDCTTDVVDLLIVLAALVHRELLPYCMGLVNI